MDTHMLRMTAVLASLFPLASACAVPIEPSPVDAAPSARCPGAVVRDRSDVRALGGCRVVTGDLRIVGSSLSALEGLERISKVEGHVVIAGNEALESVSGLRGLRAARGLALVGNPALRTLAGLERLATLGDGLLVEETALETLDGLQGLRRVKDLVVVGNAALESVSTLESVRAAGDVEIASNPLVPQAQVDSLLGRVRRLEVAGGGSGS